MILHNDRLTFVQINMQGILAKPGGNRAKCHSKKHTKYRLQKLNKYIFK